MYLRTLWTRFPGRDCRSSTSNSWVDPRTPLSRQTAWTYRRRHWSLRSVYSMHSPRTRSSWPGCPQARTFGRCHSTDTSGPLPCILVQEHTDKSLLIRPSVVCILGNLCLMQTFLIRSSAGKYNTYFVIKFTLFKKTSSFVRSLGGLSDSREKKINALKTGVCVTRFQWHGMARVAGWSLNGEREEYGETGSLEWKGLLRHSHDTRPFSWGGTTNHIIDLRSVSDAALLLLKAYVIMPFLQPSQHTPVLIKCRTIIRVRPSAQETCFINFCKKRTKESGKRWLPIKIIPHYLYRR